MRPLTACLIASLSASAWADDGVIAARRAVAAAWPDALIVSYTESMPCDGPVSADTPQPVRFGQTQVRLRCTPTMAADAGWTRFLTIKVSAPLQMAVLVAPLARGQAADANLVRFEQRDRFQYPADAIHDPQSLKGLVARRDVMPGTVLTASLFTPPAAISRGQSVTLISNASGMEVRAPGEALADATLGSRIKVRNSNSRRVVEGVARADGTVEVSL